ncbi:MAG: hydrogenase maturation nickel metallochaperone HypA [Lachnospiraceae bacterium]|nr:hydrogenase maturation nickel metallochaperone HypA [Lachnospiraceae bacterium]
MHELGLADAMMKMVQKLVKEEGAERVIAVTVSIGDLSGVVPRFMADAWEAVTDGTPYQGVPLHIETIPGVAQCLECGEQFQVDTKRMKCPHCGGVRLTPISGRDMTIEEIDVE